MRSFTFVHIVVTETKHSTVDTTTDSHSNNNTIGRNRYQKCLRPNIFLRLVSRPKYSCVCVTRERERGQGEMCG